MQVVARRTGVASQAGASHTPASEWLPESVGLRQDTRIWESLRKNGKGNRRVHLVRSGEPARAGRGASDRSEQPDAGA